MVASQKDLWALIRNPHVDSADLAEAITIQAAEDQLDFRTRLLIRDSVEALERHWGQERTDAWLAACRVRGRIEAIRREDLGTSGFPFLKEQIVEATRPEEIDQLLRELATHLHRPVQITIGGSVALIMPGYLSRRTQDVDVVDEVPAEIRALGNTLQQLMQRYRLQLTHFQSHFLPQGWDKRLHSLGAFECLQVYLVDVYDVFLSKLFSAREKDRDDLRVVMPQLDKSILMRRLHDTTDAWRADDKLRGQAEKNWYILFGEPLPS